MTAASWYGASLTPVNVDHVINHEKEILHIDGSEIISYHTPGHTPGSISLLYISRNEPQRKILFGQDIHGPFMKEFGSNIEDWASSMKKLLDLEADILCEGHFGIYHGKKKVRDFIAGHLRQNGFL